MSEKRFNSVHLSHSTIGDAQMYEMYEMNNIDDVDKIVDLLNSLNDENEQLRNGYKIPVKVCDLSKCSAEIDKLRNENRELRNELKKWNEQEKQVDNEDVYKEAILTMLGILAENGLYFSGVKDE